MKSQQVVDGLTQREVEYNVYAMASTMSRIERKLERARSERVIVKLKRQYDDQKIGWLSNLKRLARFSVKEING